MVQRQVRGLPRGELIRGRPEDAMLNADVSAASRGAADLLEPRRVAVLLPCHNEAAAVAEVVGAFRAALPGAEIYVYDNNSTDRTIDIAQSAGAVVRCETHQGKGYVVRRMFADVDADVYVLADGDATYDAPSARMMIARLIEERLDMVVGARVDRDETVYRRGHRVGNRLLSGFVTHIFGQSFSDMLSGYRVLSRRFVKSFPVLSGGFEIETELTIHALELELPVAELDTPYYARRAGSASKLNTWRDGFRILWSIFQIYRSERPLPFFTAIAIALAAIAIGLAIPIFITFVQQGNVPRFPTAILATGLMLAALLSFASGLVLDTVTRGRREIKLLAYLRYNAPGDPARE
jgi:glycosyltransferase involved in cell wall biosynthesis